MSSSINNQSAETAIANGMTFKISDINIMAPKLNKSGGKSANIIYIPSKKGLYVNMQVPILTWGASCFKDPQSGKETYDLALQFPRKDYSSPETDVLLANFQELERYIKAEAVKNCMAWFNKKMTPELVDAAWTPMLKYSKDPNTGEPDMTKSPTLKIKLPKYDGKPFDCEIYDPAGTMLFPDAQSDASPMELIPKGINIVAIIQCGGLWFANKAFGVTWRLFQAVVQPKPSMKGRCLISISPDTKAAMAAATSAAAANEVGLVIEDDSDAEEEEEAPAPVVVAPVVKAAPVVAAVPVPVVVEAPVAVVAAAAAAPAAAAAEPAVVKKKIVRKKE
jgi:hypothetical protein